MEESWELDYRKRESVAEAREFQRPSGEKDGNKCILPLYAVLGDGTSRKTF